MRKYIYYTLLACMIFSFSFMVTENAFSQTDQGENKIDSAGKATTTNETSSYVKGITAGRAKSLIGVAASLFSLIIGWRAKVRSGSATGNRRTGAIVALLLGLTGIILSIIHLSTSAGAVFGSGSGKAGAIFALLPGFIGVTLAGLSLRKKKK